MTFCRPCIRMAKFAIGTLRRCGGERLTSSACTSAPGRLNARGRPLFICWLIVVGFGAGPQHATFECPERFSFALDALPLIDQCPFQKVVLVAMLWEPTAALRLSISTRTRMLRRERANRLTNAAAGLAAIAHEIRQPLTGINLTASATQQLLQRVSPDVSKAAELLGEIKEAALRANEVFGNILRLFKGGDEDRLAVDVNALVLEVTRVLRRDLDCHNVMTSTNLGVPTCRWSMAMPDSFKQSSSTLSSTRSTQWRRRRMDAGLSVSKPRIWGRRHFHFIAGHRSRD